MKDLETVMAKLADDIREAEKQLKDIEQNRFILIGKLQALRSVEAMLR